MEIKKLKEDNFVFKKRFGQNFITDTNFIKSMVDDFGVENQNVLEIGAGAGTLSAELAKRAKKVVSIEIDLTLKDYLTDKFKTTKNIELVFADFMKLSADYINRLLNNEPFMLVANLPYYITSPIIFKLLEEEFNVTVFYIMVQKEVGERIIAKPKTKEYGNISVKIDCVGDAKIIRQVNRKMFVPSPNVDSVILEIKLNRNKFDILNTKLLNSIINSAFENRRKVFSSNLSKFIDKETAKEVLKTLFNNELIRGEELSSEEFVKLSNYITKISKKI